MSTSEVAGLLVWASKPDVVTWWELGQMSTSEVAGLPVWTSKSGEREVQPNGGDGGHVIHHENCVKQSQRREGACPSNVLIKSCTVLPLSDN